MTISSVYFRVTFPIFLSIFFFKSFPCVLNSSFSIYSHFCFLGDYQPSFWSFLFPRFFIFNRTKNALDNFLHSPHGQPWSEFLAWIKVQCPVCSKCRRATSNFKSSISFHASLNDGLASYSFVHWNLSFVEDWQKNKKEYVSSELPSHVSQSQCIFLCLLWHFTKSNCHHTTSWI